MKREGATYAEQTMEKFLQELSSGSVTPGGGCVTALVGALSSALIEMVANLTIERDKYASVSEEMKMVRTEVSIIREDLMRFIDDDARSFERLMEAHRLPHRTPVQRERRKNELDRAFYNASLVPLNVARKCLEAFSFVDVVLKRGNPHASSDARVAAVFLRSAIYGAIYHVQTNTEKLVDSALVLELSSEIQDILLRADEFERRAIHHREKERL